MRIGVGLPNSIPACPGPLLARWAKAAEDRGFSSVATIDRIAYATHDPIVSLAVAAAATERIALLANIVVGPTRNPYLLAKEAATLQSVSQGRLVLGVGVGDRTDDFELARTPFEGRGLVLDEHITAMLGAWAGQPPIGTARPIVAAPVTVPLLVAGHGAHGIRRAVRFGTGWTAGGLDAAEVAPLVAILRDAWRDAGRDGSPAAVALGYFALGKGVQTEAEQYLTAYYEWYGRRSAEAEIVAGLLRDRDDVRRAVAAYRDAGVDELVLYPAVADIGQLDLLANAIATA